MLLPGAGHCGNCPPSRQHASHLRWYLNHHSPYICLTFLQNEKSQSVSPKSLNIDIGQSLFSNGSIVSPKKVMPKQHYFCQIQIIIQAAPGGRGVCQIVIHKLTPLHEKESIIITVMIRKLLVMMIHV